MPLIPTPSFISSGTKPFDVITNDLLDTVCENLSQISLSITSIKSSFVDINDWHTSFGVNSLFKESWWDLRNIRTFVFLMSDFLFLYYNDQILERHLYWKTSFWCTVLSHPPNPLLAKAVWWPVIFRIEHSSSINQYCIRLNAKWWFFIFRLVQKFTFCLCIYLTSPEPCKRDVGTGAS